MNEETTSTTEESYEISETVAYLPTEELVLEAGTEATEETVTVVTVQEIRTVGSDIIHADLFGSFLVCGTLVGLFIFRGIHGT